MVQPGIQTGDSGINWRMAEDFGVVVDWNRPVDPESEIAETWARVFIAKGRTLMDWKEVSRKRSVVNLDVDDRIPDGAGTAIVACANE